MLKRHFAIIYFIRILADNLMIVLVWNISYFIRFHSGLFEHSGIPAYSTHLALSIPVAMIISLCRQYTGIYKSVRIETAFTQFRKQVESILLGYIFTVLFLYYVEKAPYTRVLLVIFPVLLMAGLLASHFILIFILHSIRSRGYNQRYYGIVGTGKNALNLLKDIQNNSYFGLNCAFLIDDNPQLDGKIIQGVQVYGHIGQLSEIVRKSHIDEIYMAKSISESPQIYSLLEKIQCLGITIRILPNWGELTAIGDFSVTTIGSSILFTASESHLVGGNILLKDIFDRAATLFLLCVFAIPMLLIAALVKLTSKGPVFYRQQRIGMNQRPFEILKFRTMQFNTEGSPGWTVKDDPRRTRIGIFLRSTSLDELPQLINVLKGDMSLVGPRPEQPEFVEKFSEEYKKYMFRHKVKSGMTGWAQINGLRGDTSLRKRLLYDLYYVRNWSWSLDLWILLRTPWHIIRGKNAY